MKKRAWIFCELKKGKVVRAEVYGSLRKMYKSEKIIIDGEIISEWMLRRLFESEDKFKDKNIYIKKTRLQTMEVDA